MRKRLFVGAIAGLAGAYAMQCFRSAWNRRYSAAPRHGVFGLDKEADLKSVNFLSALIMRRLLPEKRSQQIALLLHYAYGVVAGAAYSVAAEKFPQARFGYGTLFGTMVWIFGDELPITLTNFSNPFERSIRSHGSAFAAHLLFGATTELARSSQRTLFIN